MKFGKYEIDKELLEELFPDLDFIFYGDDGTEITINNTIKRMKDKKLKFEAWKSEFDKKP